MNLLQSLRLVRGSEVVKEPRVHLHKSLEYVVDEGYYGLVPMFLGDAIESGEHDGHDGLVVLFNQRHDVLVVPEVQGALGDLKNK